jgi:hypothetical protein
MNEILKHRVVSFEHRFLLHNERSTIACFAVVQPDRFYPFTPSNRVEYRREAKSKRTPQLVAEGLLRMSALGLDLQSKTSSYTARVVVNRSKHCLLNWAKHSHIHSMVYVYPTVDNLILEYWVHQSTIQNEPTPIIMEEYVLKQTITVGMDSLQKETISIPFEGYDYDIAIEELHAIHQKIERNIQEIVAKKCWDKDFTLDMATNHTGMHAAYLRSQVYK